jgi:hypothetical protein
MAIMYCAEPEEDRTEASWSVCRKAGHDGAKALLNQVSA